MNESSLDKKSIWYFGNNREENLKLSPPKWYAPFFLTTSYAYAEKYSDYGVYKIALKNEVGSKILDFNRDSDVKKLNWPKELINDIRTGKSDLNGIAYDMYILAGYGHSQEVFDKSWHLSDAAYDFDVRSENIFDIVPKHASWAREKDHRFLLQMWKDIYDAGFDGFTHNEFGNKVLGLFNLHCIDKISVSPISMALDEKQKNRALKKAFKAKGQAAFPKIKTDDDTVFVSSIPKDKALQLLKRACHDVSNFHPEYMEKAIKWSDGKIYGLFNKNDKRNVLAMASVIDNRDGIDAVYLHEMTGFIRGGYGQKLIRHLMDKFGKVYGQVALEGSGTKNDPYHPNEKLRDCVYAKIPGLKIYRVEKSAWGCPADFIYYGVPKSAIEEFLEKTYGAKENEEATLNENKATYLKKYEDEEDVDQVVEMFWHIRNKLSAPQNDIDWWINKPFAELKRFVSNFDPSNKRERRDTNYKQQAIEEGAKLLDVKDGYEIWYVPTYEAMVVLGRFYKGRSARWCVASDDPEFWYENHDDSEFVVLVRQYPQHDEFDKVAIEMMNHGRYYNEDDIIPWDLENKDKTFANGDLMKYAWQLFKDNGEQREQYYTVGDEY